MKRRWFLTACAGGLAGLAGCLGDTEYRIGRTTVAPHDGPLQLELSVRDPAVLIGSPGQFVFRLRNEGETAIEVRNRGIWPFGVLGLLRSDTVGPSKVLLDSPEYGESEYVSVEPTGLGMKEEFLVQSIDSGESIAVEYRLDGEKVATAGEYTVVDFFQDQLAAYRESQDTDWKIFSPEMAVVLEE